MPPDGRNLTLTRTASLCLVILTAFSGCVSYQVHTRHDPAAQFGAFRSYAWAETAPRATGDPRVDETFSAPPVRAAVDSGLAARGYHLASGGEADFLVTYRATVKRRLDETTGGRAQESSDGWWGPSDDVGQEPVQQGIDYSREYDEGTLVLEFLSPTTKDMLWFASAKTEIFATDTPEAQRRRIAETVAAMLERFPPE